MTVTAGIVGGSLRWGSTLPCPSTRAGARRGLGWPTRRGPDRRSRWLTTPAPARVRYATADGTVAAGEDNTAARGTPKFASGETLQALNGMS